MRIDCRKCLYFHVTWQPKMPYGCKVYGFKSPVIPSMKIKQITGAPCQAYTPKFQK
jgi:hypothetical protein